MSIWSAFGVVVIIVVVVVVVVGREYALGGDLAETAVKTIDSHYAALFPSIGPTTLPFCAQAK